MKTLQESLFDKDLTTSDVYKRLGWEQVSDIIKNEYKKYITKLPIGHTLYLNDPSTGETARDICTFRLEWSGGWKTDLYNYNVKVIFAYADYVKYTEIHGIRFEIEYKRPESKMMEQSFQIDVPRDLSWKTNSPKDSDALKIVKYVDNVFEGIDEMFMKLMGEIVCLNINHTYDSYFARKKYLQYQISKWFKK
jgi:hypothetical protein